MIAWGGIEVGAVLAGRYRVDRVLGQGGMGIVVQAMHLQLHQPVAMKFLLPEVLGNPQVVERFLREAQAAVRLKSEHVARVIDVGTLESGAPYMVLEYLEGTDLSRFPRHQLTLGGVVDLMLQACEALAEAHHLGIVHRDIKPANFFITRRADGAPLLKVLDFGISKTQSTSQLTATQAVMGTPAYMSPEQMRSSRDVDHRSDIWSLGVVLYELLQGTPPFGGDTFSSLVLQVVSEPLPKLTVRLPGDLEDIVCRCLDKDPARRFQDTAELAQALAKHAQSAAQAALSVQRTMGIVGATLPRAGEPARAKRAMASTLSRAAGARTSPPRSRRWPVVAVAGALLAGVVVAIAAKRVGSDANDPAPTMRPGGAAKVLPATPDPTGSPAAAAPPPQQRQQVIAPVPPQTSAPAPVTPPAVETATAPPPVETAAAPPPGTSAPTRPTATPGSVVPAISQSPGSSVAPSAPPQIPPAKRTGAVSDPAANPSNTSTKTTKKTTKSAATAVNVGPASATPPKPTEDEVLDVRK